MKLYNGWWLYAFEPFADQLAALKQEVGRLRAKDLKTIAATRRRHSSPPSTRRSQRLFRPTPIRLSFGSGTAWDPSTRTGVASSAACRRRTGLFCCSSKPVRVIVYAWLNDETTLRKARAKTDVYAVFQRLLARGEVPSDIEELKKRASEIEE